jgi:hypothetical protein
LLAGTKIGVAQIEDGVARDFLVVTDEDFLAFRERKLQYVRKGRAVSGTTVEGLGGKCDIYTEVPPKSFYLDRACGVLSVEFELCGTEVPTKYLAKPH